MRYEHGMQISFQDDAESLFSVYRCWNQTLETVLSEVEKDSFITLPDKGGHSGSCLKNYVSQLREDSKKFYDSKRV